MNWKTIVGGIIILGVFSESIRIMNDYHTGKMEFWPFGVEIGGALMLALGIYLIRLGQKETKR